MYKCKNQVRMGYTHVDAEHNAEGKAQQQGSPQIPVPKHGSDNGGEMGAGLPTSRPRGF